MGKASSASQRQRAGAALRWWVLAPLKHRTTDSCVLVPPEDRAPRAWNSGRVRSAAAAGGRVFGGEEGRGGQAPPAGTHASCSSPPTHPRTCHRTAGWRRFIAVHDLIIVPYYRHGVARNLRHAGAWCIGWVGEGRGGMAGAGRVGARVPPPPARPRPPHATPARPASCTPPPCPPRRAGGPPERQTPQRRRRRLLPTGSCARCFPGRRAVAGGCCRTPRGRCRWCWRRPPPPGSRPSCAQPAARPGVRRSLGPVGLGCPVGGTRAWGAPGPLLPRIERAAAMREPTPPLAALQHPPSVPAHGDVIAQHVQEAGPAQGGAAQAGRPEQHLVLRRICGGHRGFQVSIYPPAARPPLPRLPRPWTTPAACAYAALTGDGRRIGGQQSGCSNVDDWTGATSLAATTYRQQ